MHFLLGIICYDDGCHLKRFAAKRAELTETSNKITRCQIVVDKMHFAGHVDKWCQEHCNPYEVDELRKVCLHSVIFSLSMCTVNRHQDNL